MTLSIVTVLHDSAGEIGEMIESVSLLGKPRPEVVCVDSGSSDEGPELARAAGATVVEAGANVGFGAASNTGVALASGEVCALLNPDTRLLDDGLRRLSAAAGAAPVILAPRLVNADGTLQRSAHPVPGSRAAVAGALVPPRLMPGRLRDRLEPFRAERSLAVGWAIGACLVASTALLRALGPFDPGVFLYAEDMDLCLRARERGIATVYRPDVRVAHTGAHATGPALGDAQRLALQARRRREVVGARLGDRALRRDDLAQRLTFAARAAAGRRRAENHALLRALDSAQNSPS